MTTTVTVRGYDGYDVLCSVGEDGFVVEVPPPGVVISQTWQEWIAARARDQVHARRIWEASHAR